MPEALPRGTRHRLLRLAVLPATLVAGLAAAVVAYLLRSREGAPPWPDGQGVGPVLAGALVLACLAVVGGAWAAVAEARELAARHTELRRNLVRGRAEVHDLLRRVEHGEEVPAPAGPPPPRAIGSGSGTVRLGQEIALTRHAAATAVARAAAVVRGSARGSDEKVEVFVTLARRLQSLVHRELEHLDELEHEVEDPALLEGLFRIDHLATRIRRHAENIAVLGGAVARRQWSRPVVMTEVLRSALAEVEDYQRVKLVPQIEGTLRGHAVADVIHLLAELIENATVFSAPQTQVLLRAQQVTAGLAVEVEDRGLGMTAADQERMNSVLTGTGGTETAGLLADGRVGLFVVATLARRHSITVRLRGNIYGGIQAVLVLPPELLGEDEGAQGRCGSEPGGRRLPLPMGAAPVPDREVVPLPEAGGRWPGEHTEHAAAAPAVVSGVPAAREPAVLPGPPEPAGAPSPGGNGCEPRCGPECGRGCVSARPGLPRRRRQEHLAPELRRPPAARTPVPAPGPPAGHDPGLMAAFRRGVDLVDNSDDR
ncbi:hypothetical protein GCM10009716_45710 [Streptomyces sodiiphilus]|uniref:histidine kinase n=1 Tax=Streptomyces sodiiphilus TaxID=226217 RepID=A0ABN2PUL0_9ACTN